MNTLDIFSSSNTCDKLGVTEFQNLNLNFDGQNTLYATHSLHAYAAKFPPQLARYAITSFSKPGEAVLDPMVGSGTTLVETRLAGRNGIGYDIDPLACLIARTKSCQLSEREVEQIGQQVLDSLREDVRLWASNNLTSELVERATLPNFPNRDYWFNPTVARTLALLTTHIKTVETTPQIRDFLWVAFSSLILARTSVANARDIIHSRHHFMAHEQPPDVAAKFALRLQKMGKQLAEFNALCQKQLPVTVTVGRQDARDLPLPANTIDLVLTSPPYATALDYPRAHFLAVPWMKDILGVSLSDYKSKASAYIGSEQGKFGRDFTVNEQLSDLTQTTKILAELNSQSLRHANLIQRYFLDMYKVLGEAYRVLKPRGRLVIVVCPSHIRKVDVPTHTVLTELAAKCGLGLLYQHTRQISKSRRVLPYIQESFGNRMSLEYVLVFEKR